MREQRIFDFVGTVKSAKGVLKGKVVNQTLNGSIEIVASKEDFADPINRLFRISGRVTTPWDNLLKGKVLSLNDYPYVLRSLTVEEVFGYSVLDVEMKMKISPWTKLDHIQITCSPKSWSHRLLLSKVVLIGVATLSKINELPVIRDKG